MAFCSVNFYGNSIQKASGMNVILPEGKGPFPVLYLLHGLSDDHTMWQRRTSIERYVGELPLIVVMPDGGRSFYCNGEQGPYEDHIVKDVVGFVDRTFPTIPRRTGRAVAGLSMGGFGAMMLAMRHPDMFCAACSHSGAFVLRDPVANRADVQQILSGIHAKQYDVFLLAAALKKSGRKIACRLDCGTEDFLIEHNRRLHAHLDKLGLKHEYAEHPGDHNWEYWDEHIRQTLEFVMKNMGKPKTT